MTNVKDRDTLPDIVEFQGFQLLSITKRELELSLHIIGLTYVRSQNQLKQVKPTYAISFFLFVLMT